MNFPSGVNPEENQKVTAHLKKLIPYLDIDEVYFVGGLVARYHIFNAGLKYPTERKLNDIDVLITAPEVINAGVTNDFKVHHYHKTENGIYLVLIDPETSTKIDFFDNGRPIHDFVLAEFDMGNSSVRIKMRSIEDQFVEYVRDCYRPVIIEGIKNKEHYYVDMKLLREISDLDKAQKLYELKDNDNYPSSPAWRDKKIGEFPIKLTDAFEEALKFANDNPERIINTTYSQNKGPKECSGCIKNDPKFPISNPEEIFEIMNW